MNVFNVHSPPSRQRRIQFIVVFYVVTLLVWFWQFPTNFGELEYIDTASVGLALFFTAGTLVVITDLDLITIEAGWTVLTYSFYIRFLDELAEGPESLESILPGTIRLVALGLILVGFIRSTNRLQSAVSERDERLAVLNRVLRHNLRNGLTYILGALSHARERADGDTKETYETAIETAQNLSDLSEKTREIDSILDQRDDGNPINLNDVVVTQVDSFRETCDSVSFTVNPSPQPAFTSVKGIEPAIKNVIENACEHNDAEHPEVTVAVDTDGSSVAVSVRDNGSGIPSHELKPIREGDESSLNHASGIGLWFVHWVVERADGDLSFQYQDGQIVTLRLPRSRINVFTTWWSNLMN